MKGNEMTKILPAIVYNKNKIEVCFAAICNLRTVLTDWRGYLLSFRLGFSSAQRKVSTDGKVVRKEDTILGICPFFNAFAGNRAAKKDIVDHCRCVLHESVISETDAFCGIAIAGEITEDIQLFTPWRCIEVTGKNDGSLWKKLSSIQMPQNLGEPKSSGRSSTMIQMRIEHADHLLRIVHMEQKLNGRPRAVALDFIPASRDKGFWREPEGIHMNEIEQVPAEGNADGFPAESGFSGTADHGIIRKGFL